MKKHLRRWGAAYLLLGLFLVSWIGQWFAQLAQFTDDAHAHGQSFEWSQFIPAFLSSTFENWQSEWLQLLVQAAVLLGMKHLFFKADAEDTERIEAKLDALLRQSGADPVAVCRELGLSEQPSYRR